MDTKVPNGFAFNDDPYCLIESEHGWFTGFTFAHRGDQPRAEFKATWSLRQAKPIPLGIPLTNTLKDLINRADYHGIFRVHNITPRKGA